MLTGPETRIVALLRAYDREPDAARRLVLMQALMNVVTDAAGFGRHVVEWEPSAEDTAQAQQQAHQLAARPVVPLDGYRAARRASGCRCSPVFTPPHPCGA
jgi:hypothetical protein